MAVRVTRRGPVGIVEMLDYDPDIEYDPISELEAAPEIDPVKLQHYIDIQRSRQYLPYAVAAGLIGAAAAAAAWLGVTAVTNMRIAWMAAGVGLLVGAMVRLSGRGIDWIFGVVGAILTLAGCVAGKLLSGCWLVASHTQEAGFLDIVAALSPEFALKILGDLYSPVDLLFHGIGLAAGFLFSYRRIKPHKRPELFV